MDYLDKIFDAAAGTAVKLINNQAPQPTPTQVQVVERIIEVDGKPADDNKGLMYAGLGIAAAFVLLLFFKKAK